MDVQTEKQRVDSVGIYPLGISLDPETVHRFYTDNFIQRTLAMLAGESVLGQQLVRVSTSGAIHTVQSGSAIESYDTIDGNAPDAYGAAHRLTISDFASYWTLFVENNDAEIQFMNGDSGVWFDSLVLKPGYSSFQINTSACQIRNRTPGSVAVYQMIGWK